MEIQLYWMPARSLTSPLTPPFLWTQFECDLGIGPSKALSRQGTNLMAYEPATRMSTFVDRLSVQSLSGTFDFREQQTRKTFNHIPRGAVFWTTGDVPATRPGEEK
jgi:hypothetical protein